MTINHSIPSVETIEELKKIADKLQKDKAVTHITFMGRYIRDANKKLSYSINWVEEKEDSK